VALGVMFVRALLVLLDWVALGVMFIGALLGLVDGAKLEQEFL